MKMASRPPRDPPIEGMGDGRKTPLFTIDFEKSLEPRPPLPRELEEPEQFGPRYYSVQADLAAAAKIGIQCEQIHLLNLMSWPEFRTIWGKKCYKVGWWTVCIPWPYIYRRVCTRSYYLQVCHPTVGDAIGAIIDCLKQTLSPALLSLLIQGKFSQFLSIVQQVMLNCLQQKGVQLLHMFSFGIKEQVTCTNWQAI
jgi:hypothetical protein